MKLAIVGSRKFDDYFTFREVFIDKYNTTQIDLIISSGAVGTDKMAEQLAEEIGIPIKVIKPNYKKYSDKPKVAPLIRNKIIAEECDEMLAFIYGDSNGTKYTIKCAEDLGKVVHVVSL